MLNEELVFGENGYAHQYPEVRCDLYFLMDDGWDVDYGIHPDSHYSRFGSLYPNGAYSVGVFPRVIDGYHHYPASTLYCEIPEGVTTVGVFGENCEMRLRLPETPARVLVQSLIGDEVTDRTSRLVSEDTVILSAEDMKTLFATDDRTAPALLIRIEYR